MNQRKRCRSPREKVLVLKKAERPKPFKSSKGGRYVFLRPKGPPRESQPEIRVLLLVEGIRLENRLYETRAHKKKSS